MSVLPLKADIRKRIGRVCFVPEADIGTESASPVYGRRLAQGGDMASVNPALLRSREVGHLHPTSFPPDQVEFGTLCHHADSWR
jgi:hypothetical protein